MGKCVVPSCRSRDDESRAFGLSFHRFPREPILSDIWVENIGRQNWIPSRQSKICSLHFTPDSYACGNRLKQCAIPTIFVDNGYMDKSNVFPICPEIDGESGLLKDGNASTSSIFVPPSSPCAPTGVKLNTPVTVGAPLESVSPASAIMKSTIETAILEPTASSVMEVDNIDDTIMNGHIDNTDKMEQNISIHNFLKVEINEGIEPIDTSLYSVHDRDKEPISNVDEDMGQISCNKNENRLLLAALLVGRPTYNVNQPCPAIKSENESNQLKDITTRMNDKNEQSSSNDNKVQSPSRSDYEQNSIVVTGDDCLNNCDKQNVLNNKMLNPINNSQSPSNVLIAQSSITVDNEQISTDNSSRAEISNNYELNSTLKNILTDPADVESPKIAALIRIIRREEKKNARKNLKLRAIRRRYAILKKKFANLKFINKGLTILLNQVTPSKEKNDT